MTELQPFSWDRVIAAVEAVRERVRRASAALAAAEIPYAVAGGNAVAAWVSRVDRAAVRNTQDVDILVRRSDFDRVRAALESAGFVYRQVMGVDCFLDHAEANPRNAVHLIYAGERVRPSHPTTAAEVTESERAEEYEVLKLEALVRMKLNSYRDKDRTHLRDMLDVGLIDEAWVARYPEPLAGRLRELIDNPED